MSDEVLSVATPAARVPVPIDITPSLKVTVPVAEPAFGPAALIVAVNVVDCPNTVGLTDEVSVVEVIALLTSNAVLVPD